MTEETMPLYKIRRKPPAENKPAINPFELMKAWTAKQRPHEMWITVQYADGRTETRAITRDAWIQLPVAEPTSIDDFAKWNPRDVNKEEL